MFENCLKIRYQNWILHKKLRYEFRCDTPQRGRVKVGISQPCLWGILLTHKKLSRYIGYRESNSRRPGAFKERISGLSEGREIFMLNQSHDNTE